MSYEQASVPEFNESPAAEARAQQFVGVVTIALIAINVLVYLAMGLKGVSWIHPTTEQVIPWGADVASLAFNGQAWRMLTACFVHFGILHIAINMYILYQIGMFTEMLYGRYRFLTLYLFAGLAGSLVSLYVHPLGVGAGASGAIFGLYGALLAFLLVERGVVPKKAAMDTAKGAGIFLLYNFIYGIGSQATDLSAHIGGLVAGFLAGLILVRQRNDGPKRVPFAVAAAVLALVIGVGFFAEQASAKKTGLVTVWAKAQLTAPSVPLSGNGKVVYTDGATKTQATALAAALTTAGYARHPGSMVWLTKGADGMTLSFPIGQDEEFNKRVHPQMSKLAEQNQGNEQTEAAKEMLYPWTSPGTVKFFELLGVEVAPSVGGTPVTVNLMNQRGETKKVIPITTRIQTVGKNDSVWYSGTATAAEAAALGKEMQTVGVFKDAGGRVFLSKGKAGTEISYMIVSQAAKNPQVQQSFEELTREVAPSVGGLPITVHFVDGSMTSRKDFVVR